MAIPSTSFRSTGLVPSRKVIAFAAARTSSTTTPIPVHVNALENYTHVVALKLNDPIRIAYGKLITILYATLNIHYLYLQFKFSALVTSRI